METDFRGIQHRAFQVTTEKYHDSANDENGDLDDGSDDHSNNMRIKGTIGDVLHDDTEVIYSAPDANGSYYVQELDELIRYTTDAIWNLNDTLAQKIIHGIRRVAITRMSLNFIRKSSTLPQFSERDRLSKISKIRKLSKVLLRIVIFVMRKTSFIRSPTFLIRTTMLPPPV